jgi:hypothetical protein
MKIFFWSSTTDFELQLLTTGGDLSQPRSTKPPGPSLVMSPKRARITLPASSRAGQDKFRRFFHSSPSPSPERPEQLQHQVGVAEAAGIRQAGQIPEVLNRAEQ